MIYFHRHSARSKMSIFVYNKKKKNNDNQREKNMGVCVVRAHVIDKCRRVFCFVLDKRKYVERSIDTGIRKDSFRTKIRVEGKQSMFDKPTFIAKVDLMKRACILSLDGLAFQRLRLMPMYSILSLQMEQTEKIDYLTRERVKNVRVCMGISVLLYLIMRKR